MNQPVSERKRRVMRECPGERTRGLKGPPLLPPPLCLFSVIVPLSTLHLEVPNLRVIPAKMISSCCGLK